MSKDLVSPQGFYHSRGGVVWAIGKLMELNDLAFDTQNGIGPASGVMVDFKPLFAELAKLINQLGAALNEEKSDADEI